ncbi:dihydrolipoyl dehydrogenase family protein [Coleofasciculus sp. G2-EDA-02]|uniref:dihydrolipoyl dehydrogenase family protein n=1 Tax=Coleofasciculus sp. G2-EDA-02 TaxID=3069529 RepID=UPI0032F4BB5E
MINDYDLIVIGDSRAGAYAALAASQLKARVALIEPENLQSNWLGKAALYNQALMQVGRVLQQVRKAPQFGIYPSINSLIPDTPELKKQLVNKLGEAGELSRDLPWHFWDAEKEDVKMDLSPFESTFYFPTVQITEAMEWANMVVSTCSEATSPAILASLGVDVISGDGEFCRLPHLGFVVNNRRLRARAYLIATGSCAEIPDIDGLDTTSYFTPRTIWNHVDKFRHKVIGAGLTSRVPPETDKVIKPTPLGEPEELEEISPFQLQKHWLVVGGTPSAVELAQTLARLDYQVTLAVSEAHIFPQEDSEASCLVQAQLEAEGIRVLTQSSVTQVRLIEGKKWVQVGNQAIEIDEILWATGQTPNIESLNLAGVGVKFSRKGLKVNQKLQTTNPRIYACGDVIGGYQFEHIAEYEANIAIKNALFFPLWTVDYQGIPWTIFTDPTLARVGLTEAQARERYGKDVWVVRQYFKSLDKAQIIGETTGFCKLVVRRNGTILGGLIVGAGADELIGAIALLIRHKIKVGSLAKMPQASPTMSEILSKTAQEWQRQRLERNQMLQNLLEGFFNWRRNW